jgi:hypothetical protein
MACEVMMTGVHSVSTDLESLFLVLLYLACDEQVPWARAPTRKVSRALKIEALIMSHERLLARCRDDIRPAVTSLYELFYQPSYKEVAKGVTPAAFMRRLKNCMDQL